MFDNTAPYLALLLTMALTALVNCAYTNNTIEQSPTVLTAIEEPHKIQFTGKGSGAGMMLSGTMGPMGIAIGIAIDEGISNEINRSANKAGFDIQQLVKENFIQTQAKTYPPKSIINIHIKQYGFTLKPGQDDPVLPEWVIDLSVDQGSTLSIHYPKDFTDQNLPTAPLEQIKNDGKTSIKLYQQALTLAFKTMNHKPKTSTAL